MSVVLKTLTLAFHPSTGEAEAIAAFLAARRLRAGENDFKGFVGSNTNASKPDAKESNLYKSGWEIKIGLLRFPSIINILQNYNRSEPFYQIKITGSSWGMLKPVEFDLEVYFASAIELDSFKCYFKEEFKNLPK